MLKTDKNLVIMLRSALNIKEVAERYGLDFNKAGFAVCPFHKEDTASFKIWDEQRAHCFGCNKTTDVIGLTMHLFDITFQEALQKLNADFHLNLPIGHKQTIRERLTFSQKMRERERELKERRDAIRAWEEEYDRLWDLWCKYDKAIRELKPESAKDEINPFYVEAITNIQRIKYELDSLPQRPE